MKKIILLFTSILLVCLSAFGLTACESSHTHSFVNQVATSDYLKDQATCESSAVYYYSCSCGERGVETFEAGEKLNHQFKQIVSDENLKEEATCKKSALYYYSCETCGEKGEETFYHGEVGTHSYYLGSCRWCGEPETQNPDGPVHTHNFNKQVTTEKYLKTPATCTEKALYYFSCECGEKGGEFFETGSPLDHAYGDFTTNGDGTHSKVCANDNTHVVTEDCSGGVATEDSRPICSTCGGAYGATLGHTHSFTQQVVLGKYMASSATCLSPALCYYSCECGKAGEETFEVGSKTGHSYGAWTIENQETCEENGEKYRKCIWCEDTVTSVIPASGHNVKETQRQNATCEENGYVKYECDKCDYSREVIIKAGEHSISITDSKVANCTEDGYIKYECANCDYERVETVEGGHIYQVIAEKQANKTEDGYVEYKCVNCTDKYREETPALGEGTYVLLVQDSIPWTTDNAVGVLKKLTQDGYVDGYSITTASNFNSVDLSIYSVIYISNDQTTSTYNQLATLNDEFTEFVEDGGILIYGACDNGWSGGDITYSLPGGVTRYSYYSLNNYIVDFEHEIVTGAYTDGVGITNDLLQGTYCSHSGFIKNTLPEDTRIILEDGQGLPTLIEYGIGDGYVIASGLTWEFYYTRPFVGNTTYSKNVFDDLIVYAVNLFDACDHVLEQGETVSPTCDNRGYTEYHCSVCGATIKKNYTDNLGHNYSVVDMDENKAGVQHKDAGDGINFIVTLKCQKEDCQNQIEVTTTVVTTVEANCGRQGYTTFKYTYSDGIEEKTQTFNERFVDIPNPAEHVIEDGVKGILGGQTVKYDSTNRAWIDQVISQGLVSIDSEEINCTSSVEAMFSCKYCSQMIRFTIEGDHDFVDDTLNDELPTCITMGKDYATCSVCGQTELIEVTEATEHDYYVDKQAFEAWKLLDDDGKDNTALRFECDCGDWFEAYWARRDEVEGNPCAGVGSYYYVFEHQYAVEIEGGQTKIVTFSWSGLSATFTHTASNGNDSLLIQPGQILEYTNTIESLVNSNTIRWAYGEPNSCIENQVAAASCSVCGELFAFYVYGKHEFKDGGCGVCGKPDPDYVEDSGLEYSLVNNEYYVLVGRGNYLGNEIFVPSTYKGKPVKEIDNSAFRGDGQVQIVQIQNGIELIGANAFTECENLNVVIIDSEVNCFGYNAFAYCPNIEEVHFSGSIDQWVQIEFASADANPISSGVASLYIDSVVVETAVLTSANRIAHGVFYQYQKLESITISESVKSIDSFAFTNCYKLKEVNYNGSIENWAKINFFHPDSNPTYYTKDLLINGYLVNQIELSATEKISPYAFYNCKSVDRVKITESVATIGDSAFRGCSSVSTLILGENVTRIESGAFSDCSSLTSVFYCGTESQKDSISIYYNDSILTKNWYFYSQNEPSENNKYWYYVGEVPTIWIVEEKPQADLYFRNGNTVYFGSYPQTKVTDNSTLIALGGNGAPASTSTWTNYNYYVSGEQTDCMYYKDVSYNGEKYRGVYLKAYRPFWTTTASMDRTTTQDDSGYYSSNVYWFKYQPIEWEIVEEANGVATLVSKLALDAQQIDFRSDQTYRNNYAESSIRAWLNDNFYNTAFSSLQQAIIQTTLVDNSASTTQSDTNAYACANTNDKVYLLSYKEASEYFPTMVDKAKYSTDYAKSQGAYFKASGDYQGICFWWTRSPDAKYNDASTYVDTQDGFWNTESCSVQGGVVPVVKIAISSENSEALYTREGDTIYFGSYPQTKVTNTATITALGGSSAPASTSDWISYNYYVNGVQTDCMYYKDVVYNGEKYRGVYIKQYRPDYISNPSSSNYQDDNGYNFSKVYWFKYEPIEWEIVEELNGKATLVCKMILDSQNFDYRGENSYVFNYAESAIRTWLNVDFYNTAFSTFEKLIIQTSLVDNSADSTGTVNNSFACDNTNDKVYILSYIEAITYYTSDEERFKKTTDYAQSQGAATYIDSNSIYHGNGFWWLRSPDYDGACLPISYNGYLSNNGVESTREGVVPAIQIAL